MQSSNIGRWCRVCATFKSLSAIISKRVHFTTNSDMWIIGALRSCVAQEQACALAYPKTDIWPKFPNAVRLWNNKAIYSIQQQTGRLGRFGMTRLNNPSDRAFDQRNDINMRGHATENKKKKTTLVTLAKATWTKPNQEEIPCKCIHQNNASP